MRAAALLTVYEQEEEYIVDALTTGTLSAEDIKVILSEKLRTQLKRIQDLPVATQGQTEDQLDARIEALEAENKSLRRAARQANWTSVQDSLYAAAKQVGLDVPDEIDADFGRQALSLKKRINEIEIDVLDGDDVRHAARPLLEEYRAADFDSFVTNPVTADAAFAMVDELHPSNGMKRINKTLKGVYTEFFGNVPPQTINLARQEEFFEWLSRFPRSNGRSHGRNAWTNRKEANGEGPQGTDISKTEEISAADAHDHIVTEQIRDLQDISSAEKRARLAELLTPRLTLKTLEKYRDSLNRLFKATRALGGDAPVAVSYKKLENIIKKQKSEDELSIRVTKPKTRLPWSKERLAAFLTSPLFTGSASIHRRWQNGQVVTRDATYWVPLLVLTLGSRIKEILHLKKFDVRVRDGELCLALNWGPEDSGKTESARRILPVPQLLLQLGFAEWFRNLPEDQMMLFPEALARSESGDVVSAFGKHLRRILDHLGLADFDEDFYASRKTLSSMLDKAGVSEGRRQAIAGHSQGTILNCHYTAHNVEQLKSALDEADFKLEISHNPKLGFPVIRKCHLAGQTMLDLEVTLSEDHKVEKLVVRDSKADESMLEYDTMTESSAADRQKAAQDLTELAKSYSLRMPSNSERRKAVEHLMAYADMANSASQSA
ncbi:integrase [Thalassorhabdomicrobium marinisediminis]|nr:integrase [Thalassorhabdomicrobium marinisediminis]